MARITPCSFVTIPIAYLMFQFLIESDIEISMPSSSSVASVFSVIGAALSLVFAVKFVSGIAHLIKLYLLPRISPGKDYVTMYGKWSVITGGSDGIGKAYAIELAKRGMNIFILSSRENGIVSEIKNKHKNVEVRHMDVDFSRTDIYEQIEKELCLLDDIGILINNVEIFQDNWQPLVEQKREFLKTTMNVNMTSMVLMTEIVLRKMMVKNRGLIVNVSSLSSVVPLPYATIYSSSNHVLKEMGAALAFFQSLVAVLEWPGTPTICEAFAETFSVCLGAELNELNVQVKCIQPGYVRSQVLKEMDALTNFLSGNFFLNATFPDAEGFAASAVATFGCVTPIVYTGYWSNEISIALVASISVGKERLAAGIKSIIRWLTREV